MTTYLTLDPWSAQYPPGISLSLPNLFNMPISFQDGTAAFEALLGNGTPNGFVTTLGELYDFGTLTLPWDQMFYSPLAYATGRYCINGVCSPAANDPNLTLGQTILGNLSLCFGNSRDCSPPADITVPLLFTGDGVSGFHVLYWGEATYAPPVIPDPPTPTPLPGTAPMLAAVLMLGLLFVRVARRRLRVVVVA